MEVPLQILSSNASAGEKSVLASMKDLVQKCGRDEYEGIVIPHEQQPDGNPSGYRLKLLSAGGRRPIDVNEIIKRYESRIAMSMLGEFILLGTESTGSFALADSKTSLFAQALGTYLDSIASIINKDAIPRLMRLNNFPEHCFPRLTYDDVETPDLNALASSLSSLIGAGIVTPDDRLEEYVREYANLPAVDAVSGRIATEPMPDPEDSALLEGGPEQIAEPEADTAQEESDIAGVGEDVPVAAVTLNGAQVSSLLSIIEQVVSGQLPRGSAIEIIQTAFNVDRARADSIMGTVGRGFVPEQGSEDGNV